MSTREIQGHLEEIYGIEVSPTLISNVTDAVVEEVKAWQSRPLEELYPIVYLDAMMVKMRDNGYVQNQAIYVVLGVDLTALVKKVVFVTEVLPILWTGMQPFNRGERFPSAASLPQAFVSFFFCPSLIFLPVPRFYRKISRQDRLRATSPDSVDP